MYTIVCPLSKKFAPKSFQQFLDIGLLSYDKFLKTEDVESLIIVCPQDEISELLNLKILYPNIPFVFLPEEDVLACDFRRMRGWVKQQIIKLKIASWIKTEIYIPIDGDVFLVDHLKESDLTFENKFLMSSEPYQTINNNYYSVNSAWVNGSSKLLDWTIPTNSRIMSVTPQILVKDFVVNLIKSLPPLWETLFLEFGATEFTLYWLYVLKNNLVDEYIDFTEKKPLWKHDLEVNALVQMSGSELVKKITNSLNKKKSFFSVVQSWINLDTECLQDVISTRYDSAKKKEYEILRENLRVFDSKYERIRSGNKHDGGYVYLDIFKDNKIDALYGYGVGNNINFEIDFLNRHNPAAMCYIYDHTVDLKGLPPTIKFFKEGLSWVQQNNLNTLENHIRNNNHLQNRNLVLKMDVEGHEFQSIITTPDSVLQNFTQIILEVHWLSSDKVATLYQKIEFFKKMNKLFYLVHVHANNCAPVVIAPDDIKLPDVLELAYVRKDLVEPYLSLTRFPTKIDSPNEWRSPEIVFDFPPYNNSYKNIVIICSIIHGSPGSIYTSEQRLHQTVSSLKSIRQKIQNSYIIFNEISRLTTDERQKIDCDVFFCHHDEFVKRGMISENKTMGELYLIINGLKWIEENMKDVEYDRIFKIGGRVVLNGNFDIKNYDLEKVNFKINPMKKDDVFMTMFGFGRSQFDTVNSLLKTAFNTRCLDRYLENGLFQMISRLDSFNNIQKLGMTTTFSMNGIVSDE